MHASVNSSTPITHISFQFINLKAYILECLYDKFNIPG